MKLITGIEISGFRSIREACLKDIGNFSTLAGVNNSGKSNYLRALNLFFNGEVEPQFGFNINKDYYRPDASKQKKKKRIRIKINFSLPSNFNFRKGLKEVETLLKPSGSSSFSITKEWIKEFPSPNVYLNDQIDPLDLESRHKVEQFLSLISLRYIPNRVLPIDIIKKEHQALRDVLIRRVSRQRPATDNSIFKKISDTSQRLILSLYKHLKETVPDIEDIKLSTPSSLSDMIFAFGYKLKEKGIEFEDDVQGSGIQSLLMLDTLYLIDQDYFQQFGWKQASIWVIEEPESSLHCSLEASVASFLSTIANEKNSRLQIISTTHSEMIIQHSDKCYLIEKSLNGSGSSSEEISDILEKTSRLGVTSWTHPLLRFPLSPLILVEGKQDHGFLVKAFEILNPRALSKIQLSYLEKISLSESGETGGAEALAKYIKNNVKVIKNRSLKYPVITIFDWDVASKVTDVKKYFSTNDPFKAFAWSESNANPRLGREFHGFERFLEDRIIEEVRSRNPNIVFQNADGKYTVPKEHYSVFKSLVQEIILNNLLDSDIVYATNFLNSIITEALGTI